MRSIEVCANFATCAEPFDRTFDFNLGAEKDSRGAANFQRDLRFLWIVLNVRGVAGCNWWPMVVGCARFCVAFFGGGRFHARTQFVTTFHFMLLGHDLLAFDFSLLDSTAAWPVNEWKWMCC